MQEVINRDAALVPENWHEKLQTLYSYWLSLHPAPGQLPGRNDFDPLAVPSLLPILWMLDVYADPIKFKFRLMGSELVTTLGREVTGKWLDDIYPDAKTSGAFDDYCYVVENKLPLYRDDKPQYIVPDYHHIERLLLPFVDENQHCNILLGISVYT